MVISPQKAQDPKEVRASRVEWQTWKVFVFVLAQLAVKRLVQLLPTYTLIQQQFLGPWRLTRSRTAMTCVPVMPIA
ncbi:hypothetical protein AARI_07770 [Glutamicibacter arilaitensis Re117]|uniref:Uncharacterized protein n=1 Tax=Glutamicibacter arilaitensis (strain DSM 16368 / CIP 108037 / IAM 15318 / JCM 13566 / NCIMB 14258 / Re117) TaxID=861360 RepID=A0ABP1U0V1_GLUAR|nr:hypothetical protein AARI_07770 [Glutamicibacter arilaitensis Re117]